MSNSIEVTGRIIFIGEPRQVSENFSKREFALEIEPGEYAQTPSFELVGDKCALLDMYEIDQEVKLACNLRGRKWTTPEGVVKWFTTLQVWRIELVGGEAKAPPDDVPAAPSADVDIPF